jgi:FdhE protein
MPQTAEKVAFLRKTAEFNPAYRDVLPVFLEIYGAIEGRETETGVSFVTPAAHREEQIAGGFPLIAPELMEVDEGKAAIFLTSILDAVTPVVNEGAEHLDLLSAAAWSGNLELTPLLVGCLARDRKVVEEKAAALGVSSQLLEFALQPLLKTALESFAEKVPYELVEGWQEGYCPICGSRAGMSELSGEEGARHLCCSTCSYKWPYQRIKCPSCGNEDPNALSYFTAGEGPTRVDVCRRCSRYLKTRDARLGHHDVPLDAEDLATLHLDLAATKQGFERCL